MFVLRPKTWREVADIGRKLDGWVFRGQSNAQWRLETTIHRQTLHRSYRFKGLSIDEDSIVKEFQRYAHGFLPDLPAPENKLEWLSLIQHHGGPTRLLDFTHSFYVAAFFATERTSEDAAVWCVDVSRLHWAVARIFGSKPAVRKRHRLEQYTEKCSEVLRAQALLVPEAKLGVLPAEPFRMHQRMWTQQGLFLVPTNINHSFEENLAAMFGVTPCTLCKPRVATWRTVERYALDEEHPTEPRGFLKIILRKEMIADVLADLWTMNITAATLFPGLDGYARSLYHHLRYDPSAEQLTSQLIQLVEPIERRNRRREPAGATTHD